MKKEIIELGRRSYENEIMEGIQVLGKKIDEILSAGK